MNTYDQDTAQRITEEVMKIANRNVSKDNREHRLEFFRYDDKGIWPANQFDSDSIEGKCLAWKPCHEFDRASGLNRPTTPGLPFPFTGRQLAAFMLRGVGALIAGAFVDWEDGPISERLALLTEDWDRSAIDEAFDAFRAAECVVGPFDKAAAYRAQELEDSFLNTSVSLRTDEQRESLRMAQDKANKDESEWRKKMVNQLLAVAQVPLAPPSETMLARNSATPAPVVTESTEQRRARWLDWLGKGERGALQRIYEREKLLNPSTDRSFIGKEIKRARKEKAEAKRSGAMFGQLVQDGKRVN